MHSTIHSTMHSRGQQRRRGVDVQQFNRVPQEHAQLLLTRQVAHTRLTASLQEGKEERGRADSFDVVSNAQLLPTRLVAHTRLTASFKVVKGGEFFKMGMPDQRFVAAN